MKIFKKVTALVMSLTMGLSFVACGGDNGNSGNGSGNGNGGGNGGGTTSLQPISDLLSGQIGETLKNTINSLTSNTDGDGAKYVAGIAKALQNAETITITMENKMTESTDDKLYDPEEDNDSNGSRASESTNSMELVFVKTDTGYDMQMIMNGVTKGSYYSFGEGKVEYEYEDVSDAYLIDGVLYTYAVINEVGYWEVSNLTFSEMMEAEGFSDILGMASAYLTEENLTAIYNLLGKAFDRNCEVKDNKLVFGDDWTEDINAVIDGIKNVDPEQSAYSFLDDMLQWLGSEVTLDQVMAKIASYGECTVGEAYADFNNWLTKNCGANLNGIIDKIFEQKDIAALLTAFGVSGETIASIKAIDVDEYVEPYEEMTFDDFVVMIMGSMNSEPVVPDDDQSGDALEEMSAGEDTEEPEANLASFVEMLKTMLQEEMTTETLFMQLGLYGAFEGVELNQVKEITTISYDGFNMSGVEFEMAMDYATEDEAYKEATRFELEMEIELSSEKTTIALPENMGTIYYDLQDWKSADGTEITFGGVWEDYNPETEKYEISAEGEGNVYVPLGDGYYAKYRFKYNVPVYENGKTLESLQIEFINNPNYNMILKIEEEDNFLYGVRNEIQVRLIYQDEFNELFKDGTTYTLMFEGTEIGGLDSLPTTSIEEAEEK